MSKSWCAAGSKMVSSYGNVNYFPSRDALHKGLEEVFADSSKHVVIDGDDDWYAPKIAHPMLVASAAGIPVVGTFHSGISGISSSGIVIMEGHYSSFKSKYIELSKDSEYVKVPQAQLSFRKPQTHLKVYFSDRSRNEVLKVE